MASFLSSLQALMALSSFALWTQVLNVWRASIFWSIMELLFCFFSSRFFPTSLSARAPMENIITNVINRYFIRTPLLESQRSFGEPPPGVNVGRINTKLLADVLVGHVNQLIEDARIIELVLV